MDAPTIDATELSTTEGSYPYYNSEKGEYIYDSQQAEITVNSLVSAGAAKIVYTMNGTEPGVNSESLDASGGKITLPKAIPGQVTELKIRGIDADGNLGMILTLNCMRFQRTAPSRPEITRYTTDFTYEWHSNATLQTQLDTDDNSFQTYQSFDPTIYLTSKKLMLEFSKAYAIRIKENYGSIIDEAKTSDLEFAISQQPQASLDGLNFQRAAIYNSSTSQLPMQNHWFAIGENVCSKDGNVSVENLNCGKELFPNNSSECYLYLRAVTYGENGEESLYSDVVTVKICRKAPASPTIELFGNGTVNDRGTVPVFSFIGMTNIRVYQSSPDQSLEYYFAGHNGNEPWPGADPGDVHYTPLPDATNDFTLTTIENGEGIQVSEGRLYIRLIDKATGLKSAPAMVDLEPINAINYSLNYTSDYKPEQQSLVSLSPTSTPYAYNFKIMGVYETDAAAVDGKTTYYVYLMDGGGYWIKLVINAKGMPSILKTYQTTDQALWGPIVGRIYYHSITSSDKTMPEIWVTPGSEDYTAYLPQPMGTWTHNNVKECPDVTEIDERDFNRKVRLRSLTWLGGNRVRTADGRELTLYSRLKVDGYDFQADMANVDRIAKEEGTKLFAATGYVGQLNGQLALLTTEPTLQCPGTPNLFAPNPIIIDPDKETTVNAISDHIDITIKGNANGESKFYYASSVNNTPLEVDGNTLPVNRPTAQEGNTLHRVVWSELNGMRSLKPARIAITFHNPTPVTSIEDFKTKEFARMEEPDPADEETIYYQMTGKVVIEDITPEYIYVRDYTDAPEAELIDGEHMRRLLIHNSNR